MLRCRWTDIELAKLLGNLRSRVRTLCGEDENEPDDETQLLASLGALALEPMTLMRRLAAIVPPPKFNLTRFYGCFAPNARHRPLLKALLPKPPPVPKSPVQPGDHAASDAINDNVDAEPVPKQYRQPWASLLKRTFGFDVLVCSKCASKMRLVAHVDAPTAIVKILDHLGLPSDQPRLAPARAPPQMEFDDIGDDELVIQID